MHDNLMPTFGIEYRASYVITQQCIGAVFVILNLYVIIKEILKRQRDAPKFKSCLSKWLSLLCIVGGLVHALTATMHYIDELCLFMESICDYIGSALQIFVGLYQLNRLYYCFADKNVSGGYPKWLFYAMGTFGILYLLALFPYILWDQRNVTCGLTDKYEYHVVYQGWGYRISIICYAIISVLYLIWDLITLLLFVLKRRSLTRPSSAKSLFLVIGIKRNMTRIVILTIFYMVIRSLSMAWYSLLEYNNYDAFWHWREQYYAGNVFYLLSSTTMSYAVYLMEPHNSREYGLFLKRLICLKIHWFCCCYRPDVIKQREYFLPKYQAVYNITPSGVRLETSVSQRRREIRRASSDGCNDFSLNHTPCSFAKYESREYEPPTLRQTEVMRKPRIERTDTVVSTEGDIPWNDFLFEANSRANGEFSSGFGFGVYLEYWRPNKRNFVTPKYPTLSKELTKNRHAAISKYQYFRLHKECYEFLTERSFVAKYIGAMNKICGIEPGSEMSVEHMICIKLYTDFTIHQNKFKRHCRRMYKEEPIESVIRRNSEIARWSRLLKECIMFWGETMTESEVVLCGLNARLVFRSLHQRFECPLSTTREMNVARGFADGGIGVILTLKRSSPKSRYFDVAPFTRYRYEDERLFSGSTLKIIDISIGLQSLKRYVNALRMLEQIANGFFVDFDYETKSLLLSMLRRVVLMDVLYRHLLGTLLGQYLNGEEYDTDALMYDAENIKDSNIMNLIEHKDHFRQLLLRLINGSSGTF